mgnify:CR=1 FL=1
MTDFMRWLYAHYIRPYLENVDRTGYEMHISLLEDELSRQEREDLEQIMELYTGEAFLLGLRTGAGLSSSLQGRTKKYR